MFHFLHSLYRGSKVTGLIILNADLSFTFEKNLPMQCLSLFPHIQARIKWYICIRQHTHLNLPCLYWTKSYIRTKFQVHFTQQQVKIQVQDSEEPAWSVPMHSLKYFKISPPYDISIKPKNTTTFHSLTFVLHQYFQLFSNAIVPAGDVHMERVITTGFGISCLMPLLKGGQ